MGFIIDLAFIALIAISIIDGRRKGFVKIVLSLAAMVAAWFVASSLSMPVAEWANEAFVGDWLTKAIEGAVADSVANGPDAIFASIPDYIANLMQVAGISLEELAVQLGNTVDPAAAAEKIYGAIENNLVISVLRIVSFFVLYLLMNWVTSIAIGLIGKVFRLPVLKGINKLLGSVIGAIKGIFIAVIVSIIFVLVAMAFPESDFVKALDGSVIYGILSEAVHTVFGS